MSCKGLLLGMGLGAMVGAVAIMMMPSNCTVRKLANQAADKVEDAAWHMSDKISQEFGM